MYDVVCKDLHKSYDEIIKINPAFVKWHYLHAERRKALEFEEKNEFMKFLLFLVRPEVYEKLEKEKEMPEIEMVGLKEVQDESGRVYSDLDDEQFKSLVKEKTGRLENIQQVHETASDGSYGVEYYNPISVERI